MTEEESKSEIMQYFIDIEKNEIEGRKKEELNELIEEGGRNEVIVKRIVQNFKELKESMKRIIEGQQKIQDEQKEFVKGQKEIISLLEMIKGRIKNVSLENLPQESEKEKDLELIENLYKNSSFAIIPGFISFSFSKNFGIDLVASPFNDFNMCSFALQDF